MSPIKVLMLCGVVGLVAAGQRVIHHDEGAPSRSVAAHMNRSVEGTRTNLPSQPVAKMLLDSQARHISFQALLTNEQGNPIPMPNGDHELDFRIYSSSVGGVPVGSVLDVMVTLDQGVASTLVGPLDPSWFDGTGRWLGVTVDNGDELTPLLPLGSAPYAFRVDRVASAELDDDIELGDPTTSGSLTVFSGATGAETITLVGEGGRLRVGNPFGNGGTTLHGPDQLIATRDDNDVLIALYGHDAIDGGAACLLGTPTGSIGLALDGNAPGDAGGAVVLYNSAAEEAISLTAVDGTIRAGSTSGGVAGHLHLFPAAGGPSRIHLDGQTSDLRLGLTGDSSGDMRLYSAAGGTEAIHLSGSDYRVSTYGSDGQENARMWGPDWGEILLFDSDPSNDRTVSLASRGFFGDGGGVLTLFNNNATDIGVSLVGGSGSGGFGWFYNDSGDTTVTVDGDGGDGGGWFSMEDGTRETLRLDGNGGDGGGEFLAWNSAGTQTVEIDADEGNSAVLRLEDSTGTPSIVLDAAPARIGIGTSNPDQELVVQGDDPAVQIRDDTADNSANAARIELLERAGGTYDGGAFLWWNGDTDKLLVGTKEGGVNRNVLIVDRATLSVGIGTQNPGNYRLAVNGPIRAKEIVVETGWSDFVFDADYEPPTLEQIEDHINEHGHLPDIPSAEEVAEHGVKVGEMESRLLQKVEELTLHLIDMNKRVKALERENQQLKSRLTDGRPTQGRAG